MNTVPKLVFSFPLDWVASFIWLIYWEPPVCQAMPQALGAEEWARHRPCLHEPSRSCGRMPWSMSKSHRCWRPEPAPPPTWSYYYLMLMTLMVAFISLGATCGGKSWEDNHLESHNRMFSVLYWPEVSGRDMPFLKAGTDWFPSPLGWSPALLRVFLEKLEDWGQLLTTFSFIPRVLWNTYLVFQSWYWTMTEWFFFSP